MGGGGRIERDGEREVGDGREEVGGGVGERESRGKEEVERER